MLPHEVKSGVVHCVAGFVSFDSKFQTRTSPIMFAAASCFPSGLKAQLNAGGTCGKLVTNSPLAVSNTFTEASTSAAGSYFQPPGKYWPVALATRFPSGDSASCQLQN